MRKVLLTFELAKDSLELKQPHLSLLEFNGRLNDAKFIDSEYGEFVGNFKQVQLGRKNHPERSKRNKAIGCRSESANKKREETCQKKYGGSSSFHSKSVQEKSKQTIREKYGVNTPLESKEIQEKARQTHKKRYGVENPFEREDIKNRIINNLDFNKIIEVKKKTGSIKTYEDKTIKEWSQIKNINLKYFRELVWLYGFEFAINYTSKITTIEQIIQNLLDKNNIKYIKNKKVSKYKPDFIIPDYKLIIECDGLYWHSELVKKDKYYHYNKRLFYYKKGYKSLFLREDDILNNLDFVENCILNFINETITNTNLKEIKINYRYQDLDIYLQNGYKIKKEWLGCEYTDFKHTWSNKNEINTNRNNIFKIYDCGRALLIKEGA